MYQKRSSSGSCEANIGTLPGMQRLRHLHDLVQAGARRVLGEVGRFHFGAQQVADLVVEDQRQPGQAQQQHEDGADEAAPFVHPGPGLDAPAVHLCGLGRHRGCRSHRGFPFLA
jgi:hypothetical protein